MKILWYVNVVMPTAAELFGLKKTNAAGWLIEQSKKIAQSNNVDLSILNVCSKITQTDFRFSQSENINYILIGTNNYKIELEQIIEKTKPDIVHIFGTEYEYNTSLITLCKNKNIKFVVSLQGIMSEYAKSYMLGIPEKYNRVALTRKIMGKIYYADSIALGKKDFEQRGRQEIDALKITENAIGRTHWDKACVKNINNNINYFTVNENLRKEFYTGETWQYNNCQKHSIFISQGFYPIKGFHQLLKIMPKLTKRYPNLKVYVGGQKAYSLNNKFLDIFVDYFFEYQKYIKTQIKNLNLEKHIEFLGPLNAEQMKEMYLKANLFLSPSTIENSPNSVGEAMILAAPIVASNVGGVATILKDEQDGLLYDFFDEDKMFNSICHIFESEHSAAIMGQNAKQHAVAVHDIDKNTKSLLKVYKNVLNGSI